MAREKCEFAFLGICSCRCLDCENARDEVSEVLKRALHCMDHELGCHFGCT